MNKYDHLGRPLKKKTTNFKHHIPEIINNLDLQVEQEKTDKILKEIEHILKTKRLLADSENLRTMEEDIKKYLGLSGELEFQPGLSQSLKKGA